MAQTKAKPAANDLTVRKKGPGFYLKRDWELYVLMIRPMIFIIVLKYFAYGGLSDAFLDSKVVRGYAGGEFVGVDNF